MTLFALLACHKEPQQLSEEQLRDPEQCAECHPDHYRQWSGSMHAYASDDPVFRAMEAAGQQQTSGELGDFCVKCHAPAAVALGEVSQGSDLDSVAPELKGVTCWFCHQVDSVQGTHNNPLTLALDATLRGPLRDPVDNSAHPSAYSALHDRDDLSSSDLCGSCHDIVNPLGTHIERTYAEWQESLFAKPVFGLSCSGCHMPGSDGLAAEKTVLSGEPDKDAPGVKLRRVHDHSMPAVDIALTEWPEAEAQRAAVQELLDDTLNAYLCVSPPGDPTLAVVTLENVASGHLFPSGATADRRVWVEIVAYQGDTVVYESGRAEPGERIAQRSDEQDPDLWRIWSSLLRDDGSLTHAFWDAADIESTALLPVQTTLDVSDPAYVSTHVSREYLIRGAVPDRIEMAVHVQPIGLEILDELVEGGHLDASLVGAMPTFTLAPTRLQWTADMPVNSGSLACNPGPPPVLQTTP